MDIFRAKCGRAITFLGIAAALLIALTSCNFREHESLHGERLSGLGTGIDSLKWKIYSMTYAQRSGETSFHKYCVVCHGPEGKGDGFNSYNLDPRPRDLTDTLYINTLSDARLAEIIARGGRGAGKSALMPGYGFTLAGGQVADLVEYIRYLGKAAYSRSAGEGMADNQ